MRLRHRFLSLGVLLVRSQMRQRVLAVSAIAALATLGFASGAQAVEPMNVSLTVVNQRGINQFSYIKLAESAWFSNVTDGNGQFSAEAFSCLYQGKPCIRPGDHIHFSRDEGQTGPCAAPEDPAGLEYVVTSSPTQTVTLPNTTGESNHTSLTSTESWIVGKLNQDRAAHNPPLAPLHVSSTLTQAAYAIAHDRALAPSHPYPPPYCNVNLSDWGWPAPGFLNEDSGYAAPEMTLAHWDGTAGDPESINLANYGVYKAANTAVGVADGGGTWIIEYNDCTNIAPAFAGRCGMTSDTGDPNAYTPPPIGGGLTGGGLTGGGATGGAATPRAFPPLPAPVGCAANKLILTDVFSQAGKTQVLGVAPAAAVGKNVTILSSWNGKPVARTTVRADLSFTATVALPPRSLRFTNRAAYFAKLGSARSGALKFARRMYTTSITASGRSITFRGTVTAPLAKRIEPVTIRVAASCASIAAGTVVAKVSPTRSGAFSATLQLPASLQNAPKVYLQAQTSVRQNRHSKKTFPTSTLIRGVRLIP
jgi:hypothetical protein